MNQVASSKNIKGNSVLFRNILLGLMIALSFAALPLQVARADTMLYDSSGFIQGAQSFTQSFNITSAGTLTVTLSDVPWLDTISGLNVFLTTSTGLVGTAMGPGTETMSVGPGMVYAHWLGDANGVYGAGAYGLSIDFHPEYATVPLPKSVLLLLSGLGILLGWQRRAGSTEGLPPVDRAMTI